MRPSAAIAILTGVAWIALVSPLHVAYPEMVDWPGHQARHALAATLPGDPVLDAFYVIDWRPIPNLGADLAMVALEPLFGVWGGARLLLALAMGGWLAAPMLLERALWGRSTAWPLVASLFVYNAILYMGFENFYLAAPLAMVAFAGWVASEDRPPVVRHAVLAVVAMGLWFAHLVIYALFAIWVGAWELGRPGASWAERLQRSVMAGAMFVPGLLLFVAQQASERATHGGGTVWAGAGAQKLGLFLSPVLQYDPPVDLALLLVVQLIALAAIAAGRVRVHPRMQVVLAVTAVLTLAMPGRLSGVGFMDQRLPPILLGMALASTEVRWSRSAVGHGVAAVVAGALLVRVVTTHARWSRHDDETAELLAAATTLEPGLRVLPAGTAPLRHYHTTAWLAPQARVFVPNLFTGAHLLKTVPAVSFIDHPQPDPPGRDLLEAAHEGELPEDRAYLRRWWTDFDVLLWLGSESPPEVAPLVEIAKGSWFTLYRLPPRSP